MQVPATVGYYLGYEVIRDALVSKFRSYPDIESYAPLVAGALARSEYLLVFFPISNLTKSVLFSSCRRNRYFSNRARQDSSTIFFRRRNLLTKRHGRRPANGRCPRRPQTLDRSRTDTLEGCAIFCHVLVRLRTFETEPEQAISGTCERRLGSVLGFFSFWGCVGDGRSNRDDTV